MLGQSPLGSQPLASANDPNSAGSGLPIDQICPRPLAAITGIVAISGWVFAGTPATTFIQVGDQPQPPPSHIVRQVQRSQPDQFTPATVIPPTYDYGWADVSGTRPRPAAKSMERYQPDPFMPPPPTPGTGGVIDQISPKPNATVTSIVAIPNWVFPGTPIVSTPDYGWGTIPRPALWRAPEIHRHDRKGTMEVEFDMPLQYSGWAEPNPFKLPFAKSMQRYYPDPFMPAVIPPTYDYGWISTAGIRPPLVKKLPIKYQTDQFYPFVIATPSTYFASPIVLSISQGFSSTFVTTTDVFIPQLPPPIPVFIGPQIICVPQGFSSISITTTDVFIQPPPAPTFNYGWEPLPRPDFRIKPQIQRLDKKGTVSVAFLMPPYDHGWSDSYNARPRLLTAKSTQRHQEIDPFRSPPIAPTYDYGWFARPQLPTQLKPSNAIRRAPDLHIIQSGRVADYGWTVVPQRPVRLKPSNAIFRAPDLHIIQRGRTVDYGWTVVPQRPVKPVPPLGRLRLQDYFPHALPDARTHVTGLITDPAGNPATSGYVLFTLQGGAAEHQIYRVTGTTIIINRTVSAPIDAFGNISILLWGNNLITPTGSWYKVTFAPNGTIRKVTNHVYISGATYDITNPVFI